MTTTYTITGEASRDAAEAEAVKELGRLLKFLEPHKPHPSEIDNVAISLNRGFPSTASITISVRED